MVRHPRLIIGNDKVNELYSIGPEPGWAGVLTRGQAPGAIENGATIVKVIAGRGDWKPTGVRGTVLGSISHPDVGIGYFVEWREEPKVAVFVEGRKIARAE